jgi:hypothetical protein
LGLNIRSEVSDLSDVAKEQRVRLWWSLYSLECSLNELTGRPTCISDRDISTPLPTNVDIDDLESGQWLYKYIKAEDNKKRNGSPAYKWQSSKDDREGTIPNTQLPSH